MGFGYGVGRGALPKAKNNNAILHEAGQALSSSDGSPVVLGVCVSVLIYVYLCVCLPLCVCVCIVCLVRFGLIKFRHKRIPSIAAL